MSILQDIQSQYHYLPEAALRQVAKELNLPLIQVYGVATFFKAFSLTPRGKHIVRVCLGTACYVRGGQAILDLLRQEFKVDMNQTTPDLLYTLEVINCPGTCGLAPVLCVDDDVHGIPEPAKALEILKQYS
ncbi:MAG: NAD(P)H-dependent oxidoreductase subunit E [Deltaproteobacteria bacterium]|nr:NAD(P)H-dependent oxidoreductase subunit E [Deltaproteobacteria bacterium]